MLNKQIWPEGFEPSLEEEARLHSSKNMTGLSRENLAASFESLGNDCEFGFFQRYCDANVLGLFRFSNPSPDVILEGASTRFQSFCESLSVELDSQQPRREWIIVDKVRGLREHTFVWEGDQTEEAIRKSSLTRSLYLRRMMIENLDGAVKTFVIKSGEGYLDKAKVIEISQALRKWGENWLLWVQPGSIVGQVEQLAPGLLHGTIDRLTVQGDGTEPSYAGWLALISKAYVVAKRCRAREGAKAKS